MSDNDAIIKAVEEFKTVLCEQCPNKSRPGERKLNIDNMNVRSIKEIEFALNSGEMSSDTKAALEWVIYKREELFK